MTPPRTLRITELAEASHEGQVRDHNEDRALAGPDVIAVINGTVWFSNERRVSVGEESGDLEHTLVPLLESDKPKPAEVDAVSRSRVNRRQRA